MQRSFLWDIFCQVIDNFGDIGVCWRLSADLASRGHQVRLWVDDASALAWMAPDTHVGLQVLPWGKAESMPELVPADVLVEAFGCAIPDAFIAHCARQARHNSTPPPLWLNLEYLSAEAYVERCHALPSPVMHGPAAGWTKWFFYPGFTPSTGGLLQEPGLALQMSAFDSAGWLNAQGVKPAPGALLVALFCYEPAGLPQLLEHWSQHGVEGQPVHLLVTAGRATQAVKHWLGTEGSEAQPGSSLLSITYLPLLSQSEFDHLLWSTDLNFVRGEDSVLRALWAGKPFVWNIYPQEDDAHAPKLEAFLETLQAPAALRQLHRAWNGVGNSRQEQPLTQENLADWAGHAQAARTRFMTQDDLTTRMLQFVVKNR